MLLLPLLIYRHLNINNYSSKLHVHVYWKRKPSTGLSLSFSCKEKEIEITWLATLCSMEEICYVSIPIFKHKQGVAPQWAICIHIFHQMKQVMNI